MLETLKKAGAEIKARLTLYRLVLKHERTPAIAKAFLGLAIGYTLMPFDLIPDFIPVLGHLDDAVIVPLLLIIAIKMVPKDVMEECRKKMEEGG